jgi:hypothetical protein
MNMIQARAGETAFVRENKSQKELWINEQIGYK